MIKDQMMSGAGSGGLQSPGSAGGSGLNYGWKWRNNWTSH